MTESSSSPSPFQWYTHCENLRHCDGVKDVISPFGFEFISKADFSSRKPTNFYCYVFYDPAHNRSKVINSLNAMLLSDPISPSFGTCYLDDKTKTNNPASPLSARYKIYPFSGTPAIDQYIQYTLLIPAMISGRLLKCSVMYDRDLLSLRYLTQVAILCRHLHLGKSEILPTDINEQFLHSASRRLKYVERDGTRYNFPLSEYTDIIEYSRANLIPYLDEIHRRQIASTYTVTINSIDFHGDQKIEGTVSASTALRASKKMRKRYQRYERMRDESHQH